MATPGTRPRLCQLAFGTSSGLLVALALLLHPLSVRGQVGTPPVPNFTLPAANSTNFLNCSIARLLPPDNGTFIDYRDVSQEDLTALRNDYMESFQSKLGSELDYCVRDLDADKQKTFGYAGDPETLNKCQLEFGEGLDGFLCRSSEIEMYFNSIITQTKIQNPTYCDYSGDNSQRIPACAPGFMSKIATDLNIPQKYTEPFLDVKGVVPCRSTQTFQCCPGFFCPVDLACMIPCPRGAHCPRVSNANLHNDGACLPYGYIPSNIPRFNETSEKLELGNRFLCGGADRWTVADQSQAIFCSPGSFCNATTKQESCPPGSYCRMGEVGSTPCGMLASCPLGTKNQDQWRLGILVVCIVLAGMFIIQYISNWLHKRRIAWVDRRKAEVAAQAADGDTYGPKFASRLVEVENGLHSRSFRMDTKKEVEEEDKVEQEIELEFLNLSLRLKRGKKTILRSITGKLQPGQVTAVMGPSGAGKTTFLTAVAGKASNATEVTGTVKINGKPGDLREYRKIIGFVPQDDIVHSDLTVRENLAFSASYRLPKAVTNVKREQIIDRVVDSLGLEPIQHSLVGSVAKRGISGGQRKRVNVGMEMVMEPSLLILDEPTSGLDSTSSRLVIEALRLEALRGVNIGVVLHQPSYTIFHMFDNVMFLAKGGLVVYHGEVKMVDRYFASLGYIVPDKINPPDYFMDVLEGQVESENSEVTKDKLAFEWAKFNGSHLLESDSDDSPAPSADGPLRGLAARKLTFADLPTLRETLAPVGNYFEDLSHSFAEAFHTRADHSGRATPGFPQQFVLILFRCAKQRYLRGFSDQVMKFVIMLVGGLIVGALSQYDDKKMGVGIYFPNLLIALSLLVMISSLPTFSADVLNFYRESASGINRVAFFLAKDILDLLNAFLLPLFFNITFYSMKNPKSTFAGNLMISTVMSYGIMGYAYIFSITLPPASAQMSVVMFCLASVLLNSGARPTGVKAFLQDITFARYAQEAFVVATTNRYSGVFFLTRCFLLKFGAFNANHFNRDMLALIAHGLVARVAAFVCLLITKRDKQR